MTIKTRKGKFNCEKNISINPKGMEKKNNFIKVLEKLGIEIKRTRFKELTVF